MVPYLKVDCDEQITLSNRSLMEGDGGQSEATEWGFPSKLRLPSKAHGGFKPSPHKEWVVITSDWLIWT